MNDAQCPSLNGAPKIQGRSYMRWFQKSLKEAWSFILALRNRGHCALVMLNFGQLPTHKLAKADLGRPDIREEKPFL